MALKSMTGFGAASAIADGVRVTVELSAVNRKQLDVILRLPPPLAVFESRAQKIIQEAVSRGRVSATVHLDAANGNGALEIDQRRAADTVRKLRRAAKALDLPDDLRASLLLQIPGLLKTEAGGPPPEELYRCLETALRTALGRLNAMRAGEGRMLEADVLEQVRKLETVLDGIRRRAPRQVSARRKKLRQALEDSGLAPAASDERVLREIALFAERSDIAEELTRLASHLEQFKKFMRGREPAGRTLDFLSQELLREINTVASKSNDLKIAQQAVQFKAGLERIREQVQNIE